MPEAERRLVSVTEMGRQMLLFAIDEVTEPGRLISLIEQNARAADRMADAAFWFEFYAFALFPGDVALLRSDMARSIEVRREMVRQGFANLTSFFTKKSQPHMSMTEWNQFYHDRTVEYAACVQEGTGKALEILGTVACTRILNTADMKVAVGAALSYADSLSLLSRFIRICEIES